MAKRERNTTGSMARKWRSVLMVSRWLTLSLSARKEIKGFLVIDGQERPLYDAITPAAQSTLYFGADSFSYLGVRDGSYYWVEEKRIAK